jgi:soluble lytic murein transglycosylase
MKTIGLLSGATLVLVASALSLRAQQGTVVATVAAVEAAPDAPRLLPTIHPPLPRERSGYWLAPVADAGTARVSSNDNLRAAAQAIAQKEYSKALTLLAKAPKSGSLGLYATYYAGVAQQALARYTDALASFKAVRAGQPIGYLGQAAKINEAAVHEALQDPGAAVVLYEQLANERLMHPDEVFMRMGLAEHLIHERNKAADAFARVYYEYALSDRAKDAALELEKLGLDPAPSGSARYKLDLGRAERLFGVRDYADARTAFEALRSRATDEDRGRILLRLAACDYFQKRYRNAVDRLKPLMDAGPLRSEAMYYYAAASKGLQDTNTYLQVARQVADQFPTESWAEEALNSIALYHVSAPNDDEAADVVFRELYAKYPRGKYAERAAWKIGWRSYRQGRYDETIAYFESASRDFPRSDYRPAWLYWAGRAHEQRHATATAALRYQLETTDYANSYYGRLAVKRLAAIGAPLPVAASLPLEARDITLPAGPPPNAGVVQALLEVGLYDAAVDELRYAQLMWGDSPAIQATIAWTNQQQSVGKKGIEQFQLLRGSINLMRRAYPQFLTVDGDTLPRDVLAVIFPIAYWDLIRQFSAANHLDPFLMAALVAQESTFVPDIRSSANAYGLMQLMPATARRYATRVNLKYSLGLLTRPEPNIRMGMAVFADLMNQFGSAHLALAGYNAGPTPVKRWVAERPGIDVEEFIDDIPYPETQNYVKRILGTADDYRRLYGPQTAAVNADAAVVTIRTAAKD